jgi:DNA-binding transcriptional ArsR family regulator
MKHLDVLREAGLVNVRKEGRRRMNSINAVPLHQIYRRWVSRFEDLWARNLTDIQAAAEEKAEEN